MDVTYMACELWLRPGPVNPTSRKTTDCDSVCVPSRRRCNQHPCHPSLLATQTSFSDFSCWGPPSRPWEAHPAEPEAKQGHWRSVWSVAGQTPL